MSVFTPDGRRLITGPWDRTLRVWDVLERRALPPITQTRDYPRAVSADGGMLAGLNFETTTVHDLASGMPLGQFKNDAYWSVMSAAFSPDGATLAVGLSPQPECYEYLPCLETVVLWDLASGLELGRLEGEAPDSQVSEVLALAYSLDGATLAVGPSNGRIKLWDVAGGQILHTLETVGGVNTLAASPDGWRFASASGDGGVALWDFGSARKPHRLTPGGGDIEAVALAFSPDGALLAVQDMAGDIRLWETSSGRLIQTIATRDSLALGVVFVGDGAVLASGGAAGEARLWNVETGWEIPAGEAL